MHRHMARRDGRECESDSRQRRTNPTNGLQALHFPRLTEDGGSAARLGKAQLKPSRRHRAALRPRRFATLSERCSWQARSNRAASDANAKPFTGNDARGSCVCQTSPARLTCRLCSRQYSQENGSARPRCAGGSFQCRPQGRSRIFTFHHVGVRRVPSWGVPKLLAPVSPYVPIRHY